MLPLWILLTALAQDPEPPPTEPAPPAPEAMTPRARLDAAWRRLDEGDAEGALLLVAQVLPGSSEPAEPWYLAGIARHAQGDHQGALDALLAAERTGEPQWARDAVFRAALVELDRGRDREVLRTLRRLGPLGRLAPRDRAKVELVKATAQREGGRPSGARQVERAVAGAPADLTWFIARARLADVRAWLHVARAQTLDVPEARLRDRVTARADALRRALEARRHLEGTGEVGLLLDAQVALADAQETTAEALLASTIPALSPEQERLYRGLLAGQVSELLVHALRTAEDGVDLALSARWRGPQTEVLRVLAARAHARVEELSPSVIPLPPRP